VSVVAEESADLGSGHAESLPSLTAISFRAVEFLAALERVVALPCRPPYVLAERWQRNVKVAKEQRGGDCKGELFCHLSILDTSHELFKTQASVLIL
jgi:hypothetical protein